MSPTALGRPLDPSRKTERAPRGYDMFKHKEDDCTKVVLKP